MLRRQGLSILWTISALLLASGGFALAQDSKNPPKEDSGPNSQRWLDRLLRMGESDGEVPFQRNTLKLRSAFKDMASQASQSAVKILSGEKPIALGTIVDADGFILTKASELRAPLSCELKGGRRLDVQVVGVAEDHDLALLRIETKGLTPIAWRKEPPIPGSWLASLSTKDEPFAIGVASVLPRRIPNQAGFLGIVFDDKEESPKVNEVIPSSGAANAGLKVGDFVVRVNDKEIKNRQNLVETIRGYKPGESVKLRLKRGDKELDVEARIGVRPEGPLDDKQGIQNSMGGPLSERRVGFPSVLQHDTVLRPNECGGPIVDLEGKAVGINIARAGRVMSFAIPSSIVETLVVDLRNGKYPVPKQLVDSGKSQSVNDSKQKVARLEAALLQAQASMAAAEIAVTLSQEALRKAEDAKNMADAKLAEAKAEAAKAMNRKSEAQSALEALKTELDKARADERSSK